MKKLLAIGAVCYVSHLMGMSCIVDGVEWQYYINSDGEAIIGTEDRGLAIPADTVGSVEVPSVIDGHKVVGIGAWCFADCTNMTSCLVQSGVTEIGERAFYNCKSLANVSVPATVRSVQKHAFSYCQELQEVTLPPGVTNVGDYAFCSCRKLSSISFPDGLKFLGEYSFWGCLGLRTVVFNGGIEVLNDKTFYDCANLASVTLPPTLREIKSGAFSNCKSMDEIVFPSGLCSIGSMSFSHCDALGSVVIPDGVITVEDRAFDSCSSITNVCLPTSLEVLGSSEYGGAFYGCKNIERVVFPARWRLRLVFPDCYTSIQEVVIPVGEKIVMDHAFMYCSGIRSVVLPESLELIDSYSFWECLNLQELIIPEGVEKIGQYVFYHCDQLRSIILPEFLWEIGAGSFGCCGSLKTVKFPAGIPIVPYGCFQLCKSLECVTLPNGVKEIGNNVFAGCEKLKRVDIPCTTIKIGADAFYGCTLLEHVSIADDCVLTDTSFLDSCSIERYKVQSCVEICGISQDYVYDGGAKEFSFDILCSQDAVRTSIKYVGNAVCGREIGRYIHYFLPQEFDIPENLGVIRIVCGIPSVVNIQKRKIEVMSFSDVKAYDGLPLMNDRLMISGDGFVVGEGAEITCVGKRVLPGSSPNVIRVMWQQESDAEHYDLVFDEGTLTVLPARMAEDGSEPGVGCVHSGGLSKFDGAPVEYDGKGHTINVEALESVTLVGDTPRFSYALMEDGPYRSEPYCFTNVGTHVMWYKISAANYEDFEHEARVTILPSECCRYYVSAQEGSDANSGQSADSAFVTIQRAIDEAEDGDVILVADGKYEPIDIGEKRIEIRSADGPLHTIIDGGGTNRCVTVGENDGCVISGFTLANGTAYNPAEEWSWNGRDGGGGVNGGRAIGCVISNCVAMGYYAYGGGAVRTELHNCLIVGNSAIGSSWAEGGGTKASDLYNCTVVGNRTEAPEGSYGAGVYGGKAYNTIIVHNTAWSGEYAFEDDANGGFSEVVNCWIGDSLCFSDREDEYLIRGSPRFVDAARGDCRLAKNSPCLDMGNGDYVMTTNDLARNERIQGVAVDLGAYEGGWWGPVGTPPNVTATIDWAGMIRVSWDEMGLADGYAVYRSMRSDFSGFEKIGDADKCVLIDTNVSSSCCYYYKVCATNDLGSGALSEVVEGRCVEPRTSYVDGAAGGDDWKYVGDGSEDRPFRFIYEAADAATPGDRIIVAPGEYNCCMSKPVTVIAAEGPSKTRIEGVGYVDWDIVFGWKATIRGFTVTTMGCAGENVIFDRCLVTGCEADECLARNCTFNRCTVTGNMFSHDSWIDSEPVLFDRCELVDTIVWGNEGDENDVEDPFFVSEQYDDYRLRVFSPWAKDGSPMRGCFDEVIDGFVITATKDGGGRVDKKYAVVPAGGSVTFNLTGVRPVDHFEVDGCRVESPSATSFAFENVQTDAELKVVFKSETFYVDAAKGDDDADGLTWDAAKASIQAAINASVNGDRIVVADGVYAPIVSGNRKIVIESVNGCSSAVIDGGLQTCCALLNGAEDGVEDIDEPLPFAWVILDSDGMPSMTNTVLRGFTLRNGWSQEGASGGVMSGTVESCLIIWNVAEASSRALPVGQGGVGGGAFGCVLKHCTIAGNTALSAESEWGDAVYGGSGGGVYGCILDNCILVGNEAPFNGQDVCRSTFANACYVNYTNDIDSASFEWILTEDPRFVDYANCDYRILPDSPYVVNGKVTIGCFEEPYDPTAQPAANVLLISDSAHPWQNVSDTVVVGTWVNSESYQSVWQSGDIGDDEATVLSATVNGEGKIGFWWKVSCEKYKSLKLDNLEFSIDGVAQEPWINGETDWAYLEFNVTGPGDHLLRWTYSKDEEDDDGQDCGWVTGIRWTRKLLSFSDYLNCDNLEFVTSGDANWGPELAITHDGEASLRSGAIGDSQVSRLEAEVSGAGTISFWWNASSESYKSVLIDKLTFMIDGAEVSAIGSTAATWSRFTKEVTGAGPHTLAWVYSKDESDEQGEDCGWLDEVTWTPSQQVIVVPAEITGGKEIVVDESWPVSLDERFGAGTSAAFTAKFGADLSAALLKSTGKKSAAGEDMYVWQDYVAGTDPTDLKSEFTAKIEIVDGEPVVIWSPKLSEVEEAKRIYTIYGKKTLDVAEPWTPVETPSQGGWRFFKVGVEMR